jgi:GTP-binding protein
VPGTPVIVGFNKTDLLNKQELAKAEEQARDAFAFAGWVPLVRLSAKTGRGLGELVTALSTAAQEFGRRIPTAELNRFFKQILERHPPPTSNGRAPRIFYITQAEARPPLFVAQSNAPEYIKDSYKRFVASQIRKSFGFSSVPIVVQYRKRKQKGER